jgi:hypothetical protein
MLRCLRLPIDRFQPIRRQIDILILARQSPLKLSMQPRHLRQVVRREFRPDVEINRVEPVAVQRLIECVRVGFDHGTLKEVHELEPEWNLEIITHCRMADWVHEARAAGSILVSMEPEFAVKADIEAMHKSGLSVLTTLLSIEHGRELLDMGVDFFESDDVQLARDALRDLGRG